MVDLLNSYNYMAYWYGIRRHATASDAEAYEIVESECNETYGVGMYDSFDAFRKAEQRYRGKVWNAIHTPGIANHTIKDILTIAGYVNAIDAVKKDKNLSDVEAWFVIENDIRKRYNIAYADKYSSYKSLRNRYIQAMLRKKQRANVYQGKRTGIIKVIRKEKYKFNHNKNP